MNQEETNRQANRFWFPVKALGGCVCGCGGELRGPWVRGTPDYNRSSILSLPLHMLVVTVLTTLPSLC